MGPVYAESNMRSVDECWECLESFATKSVEGIEYRLPEGASQDAIILAEEEMGVDLPTDFRTFLLRHDGSGDYFLHPYWVGGGELSFLALSNILRDWRFRKEIADNFWKVGDYGIQDGPIKKCAWNRQWIAFTESGCGDCNFIDLDPPGDGFMGQIVDWGHESSTSTFQSRSFREWLNDIVDTLQSGESMLCVPGEDLSKYTIEFDRLPERLGTYLTHPNLEEVEITIWIERGKALEESTRFVIESHGYGNDEFFLVNGDDTIRLHYWVSIVGGKARLEGEVKGKLKSDARLVVKIGYPW